MEKFIVNTFIILLCSFSVLAQSNEEIISHSLEFLDKKFHLNFEKAGEPILVHYKNEYYIYDSYNINKNLTRFKIYYFLEGISEDRFKFTLKWAGEIQGTFSITRENGNYRFLNLEYVRRSH